jgi:type IV secretion system protein VirB2
MKTTVNFMKKNASLVMFAMMLSLMFVEPSFATEWSQAVTDFAENISDGLKLFGAAVITIAFMFAGFQIAFGGKNISALMPIVIGALVIGGAASLAGLLIKTAE